MKQGLVLSERHKNETKVGVAEYDAHKRFEQKRASPRKFPNEWKVVGDPGIEPGVRLREGVTVPCHTLRPVAHRYENTSNERLNRRTNHVRQH